MLPKTTHPSWLSHAAEGLLPLQLQTELLKACLLNTEAATGAWQRFMELSGDPKSYFEASQGGIKGLLPYVETRLATQGIKADKGFHTYSRVALVREELRRDIYQSILQRILEELHSRGVNCVLLKGAAFDKGIYPEGARRHNHGIDLLVHQSDLDDAQDAVIGSGCTYTPQASFCNSLRFYRHHSGLSVSIRSQLFNTPYLIEPTEVLWNQSIATDGSGHVRVLSPEHNLLHVLGEAAYSPTRSNLRWVCDCVHILNSAREFRWPDFTDAVLSTGLDFPAFTLLVYLRDNFSISVPDPVLELLSQTDVLTDVRKRRAIYSLLLTMDRSRSALPQGASWPVAERLRIFWFRLCPPPSYLRWKYRVRSGWRIAMLYIRRPLRYLAHGAGRQRPVLSKPPLDANGGSFPS